MRGVLILLLLSATAVAGVFAWKAQGSTDPDPSTERDATPNPQGSFLSDEERLLLFDLERADLILGRVLAGLGTGIREKSGDAVRTALAEGFQGRTPSLGDAIRAARAAGAPYGAAVGGASAPRDAAGLVAWLGKDIWPHFASIEAVSFGRKFNARSILEAPPVRATSKGVFRIAGRAKGGGFLELTGAFEMDHTALGGDTPPETAYLHRLDLSDARVVAAPQRLFRETTKATGIDTAAIHDNWVPEQLAKRFEIQDGGVFLGDANHDGHLDLLVTTSPRAWLYLGDGAGAFQDSGWNPRVDLVNPTSGAIFDATGDGRNEILVDGRLYAWSPKHRRVDRLPGASRLPIQNVSIADYDRDGLVDLYFVDSGAPAPESRQRAFFDNARVNGRENELYRNLGGGRFENVTATANASGGMGRTFAAVWFYANDDLWPDLFGANEFGRNVFLINQGDGTFREADEIDAKFGGYSMGVSAGDLDNDGRQDLYVSNMYSKAGHRVFHHIPLDRYPEDARAMFMTSIQGNKYYRNRGDGAYDDESLAARVNASGWGWSSAIADWDLDGRLDIYAPCGHTSSDRTKPDG